MYASLIDFFTKHNILYENQFGFQSNMPTEYAVKKLLNYITDTLEKNEYRVCIFLDFAKAFDTVNHDILIKRTWTSWHQGSRSELIEELPD